MYIVGSAVSDDEIPKVIEEVKKSIEKDSGKIEKTDDLGKKKLAYPIKKTRNGYYVVVNFSATADKINDIEHSIRTSQNIIRHLIINIDDDLIRIEKDRAIQAKLKPRIKPVEEKPAPAKTPDGKKINIDLDAEIEKALESKDLK